MRISNAVWRYNIPLVHFNVIIETLIYLKVYHDEFTEKNTKKTIKTIAILFSLFSIVDSFWLEGFGKINSYTNLAESIIVIGLSLLFFEELLVKNKKYSVLKTPMFAATVGIIIYLSGTIVLYLTTNHFIALNNEYYMRLIYIVNAVLLLLLSMLLSRAFLLVRPIERLPQ